MKELLRSEEWVGYLLDVYEDLVESCLIRCGVHRRHSHRADLSQLAQMTLIRCVEQYRDNLVTEEAIDRFAGFAYQRIRWRLIDEIRRIKKCQVREQLLDDEHWRRLDRGQSGHSFQKNIEVEEIYQAIYSRLSIRGQKYLYGAFQLGMTPTEMCQYYGVSRQTIYNWRREVQDVARTWMKDGKEKEKSHKGTRCRSYVDEREGR